ncbi:MAG: AsmA family protein, partial [Gammaproteobacteria bacterium]|nr:AsmA family protein [Gammaproteobacteria bacterium]MDX2486388.1 AsmA family protein [Gammaproteobacteria bacterium]
MKLAKLIIRILISLVVLVSLLIGIMMVAEVSIPLDSLRQPFIDTVEESTGREVKIEGDVRLTVSLFPALVMERLELANEAGWQDAVFISLGKTRIQVSLLPLLQGEFEFKEVSAEQAVINLEQRADGSKNWSVVHREDDKQVDTRAGEADTVQISDRVFVNKFKLVDITFTYRDEKLGRVITDHLDELQINSHDRRRLTIELAGDIDNIPYTVKAKSDLLRNLISGKPWNLDAEGEIGGRPLSLTGDILITDGNLDGKLDLNTGKVDIGGLLEFMNITQGLEFTSGQVQVKADLKGDSLHDIVNQSDFEFVLKDGLWKLGSHVDKRFQTINFQNASIYSKGSQDLDMKFSGKVGREPLDLRLKLSPLEAFIKGLDKASFLLEVNVANTDVRLDGNIKLPVSSKTLNMNVDVSGQRLDQWNSLLISDLPPYGPYKLTGNLGLTPKGFHVADFRAMIGESDLSGTIDINMSKQRPVWTMNMVSNKLQFNDFIVEGYTLIPGKTKTAVENAPESKPDKSAKEKERELSQKLDQRLGETLEVDQWDIDVSVESRNVFS